MTTVAEPYYWWVHYSEKENRWVVNGWPSWIYEPPSDVDERVALLDAALGVKLHTEAVIPGIGRVTTVLEYGRVYRFVEADDDGSEWRTGGTHYYPTGEDNGTGTSN